MVSEDMEHIEYLYGDYHREAYEDAIGEDVRRIAEGYHFSVQDVVVELSEEYEVEYIALQISGEGEASVSRELKAELRGYYQLEEKEIEIRYGKG